MLPRKHCRRLSYPINERLAAEDRVLTFRFVVPLQRLLVTGQHKLMKRFSPTDPQNFSVGNSQPFDLHRHIINPLTPKRKQAFFTKENRLWELRHPPLTPEL